MAYAYDETAGEIVMFGGCCDDATDDYHGDTWTWTPSGGWVPEDPENSPGCRASARMAYDGANGNIVLFGGRGSPTGCTSAHKLNDTWIWDGTDWEEQFPSPEPGERSSPALAYDPRTGEQNVVMFGGLGDCGEPNPGEQNDRCNDAWVWNGTLSTWTQCQEGNGQPCQTRPEARSSPAIAYHADRGEMVVAGGLGDTLLDDTRTWDGIASGWGSLSVASYGARSGHRMAYDPLKEAIVLFGGCTANCGGNTGEVPGTVSDATGSLNGGNWEVKAPADPPSPRCCGGMVFFDGTFDHVVYFGGQDQSGGEEGLSGVWYWEWDEVGDDGEWIECTGTDNACT